MKQFSKSCFSNLNPLASKLGGFFSTQNVFSEPHSATKKLIVPHKKKSIIVPDTEFFDPSKISKEELEAIPGYTHSTDSFGTLDGPGTRFLLYLSGCPFRCVYCHNPDTWTMKDAQKRTIKGIVNQYEKFLPYYSKTGGGITVSGGEPFLQPQFLTGLLYYIKQYSQGNTCVETAGFGTEQTYNSVLKYTDHVLFCVKHTNAKDFELITKSSIQYMRNFIEQLKKRKTTVTWTLRYVVLPGLTDRPQDIDALIDLIKDVEFSTSLTRVELLPYHELGVHKWKEMGMEYPLPETLHKPSQTQLELITDKIEKSLVRKDIDVIY